MRRPIVVNIGKASSNASRLQPAKIEILPVSALWHPPETGQSIGNYYIGYNSSYQESASLKILQHLPISSSTYRTSDGGGNGDPAINIVASYVGSGANSTSHLGGSIQFTTQTRDNPTSGGAHGQAYAGIYGGRHSGYTNYEGEMIFYTADTTNRASGANLNPRMTIKGASVGIATTSPGGRLHTVGSRGIHALRVTGNSGSSAQVYITGANYGIRVTSAASSGSYYSAFFHTCKNDNFEIAQWLYQYYKPTKYELSRILLKINPDSTDINFYRWIKELYDNSEY